MAPSRVTQLLRKSAEQHGYVAEALASSDPRSAIVAVIDELQTLTELLDELLGNAVRITRRRT